jgi:hypothetical protein
MDSEHGINGELRENAIGRMGGVIVQGVVQQVLCDRR